MRKDMAKVIVERPRLGLKRAKAAKPGRTRVIQGDDGEPLAAREPTRKAPKTKVLNENLNPLIRYLGGQVGRPWSKVYSEICENLRPTSTVQQHVRDHVADFVATDARMQDGKVVVRSDRRGAAQAVEDSHFRFYVHPRTGLLKRNETAFAWKRRRRDARAREAAERDARMRVIDKRTQLHLFDDVWWEVKVAKSGRPDLVTDVVMSAGLSTMPAIQLYGDAGLYAVDKRVLSKAEKKKLGLSER